MNEWTSDIVRQDKLQWLLGKEEGLGLLYGVVVG